ncbi:hypothetical protein BHU72_02950 [Desulfuribacillus stibiiarsenatis]|uniref:PPM-type phosphatase domain-containing protein n=1 Tax=Desulfuribacillus stibiiarsenatis TaxID=1390249 RepID=A0A1E5L6K8_9FIRM|nr:Stp1/IreP family PP2C-type Ser/Thr phosphatase [Desulfuribacillus stibiiarsenatis]OEH85756.1 hypothetical protein BHU72_02950 [Desulfuribacillus stibiiarsenatis]
MEWAAKSDVGLVRKTNEDSFLVRIQDGKQSIAIVADGMGGHQGGKIASKITVETILEGIDQFYPEDRDQIYEIDSTVAIKRAVKFANQRVYDTAQEDKQLAGMGTTVVIALLNAEQVEIAHVGDSRAYIISKNGLTQITDDHSLVNELLAQGKITEEEAIHHPQRNMITRALGTSASVIIDIAKHVWEYEDILLLCSDGLSESISSEVILQTFYEGHSLEDAVNSLLEKSLQAGGKDNITIVAIKNLSNHNDEKFIERGSN